MKMQDITVDEKSHGLTGAQYDTLWCLFLHGPTEDGNVPSKVGRDELVDQKLAERGNGFQWLTRAGVEKGLDIGFESKKYKATKR